MEATIINQVITSADMTTKLIIAAVLIQAIALVKIALK
jgi:hypothetical protein